MSQREQAITPASFASFGALLRYLRQRALLGDAERALQPDTPADRAPGAGQLWR